MADTVSQDQINELLRTMQVQKAAKQESGNSGQREKTKYSKYDFYSPRKFTKDKMKILTSAFENYARVITSQLNGAIMSLLVNSVKMTALRWQMPIHKKKTRQRFP